MLFWLFLVFVVVVVVGVVGNDVGLAKTNVGEATEMGAAVIVTGEITVAVAIGEAKSVNSSYDATVIVVRAFVFIVEGSCGMGAVIAVALAGVIVSAACYNFAIVIDFTNGAFIPSQ